MQKLFTLLCFLFIMTAGNAAAAPLSIHTDAGAVRFNVEIATSQKQQETGLMYRTRLPERTGMLFAYGTPPRVVSMWMRHTLIPLDMLFIDEHGMIVNIHAGAKPNDETIITSRYNVTSVLEIPAGSLETYGISVGNTVSLSP